MTNEEIYKYAGKKFGDKREKVAITKFLLGTFGFVLMYYPVLQLGKDWHTGYGIMDLILSLVLFFCLFFVFWKRVYGVRKEWREFVYNLVRKDERMRIAVEDKLRG